MVSIKTPRELPVEIDKSAIMLKAVADTVNKALDSREVRLRADMAKIAQGPPKVENINHVDTSAIANAVCLIAKQVQESISYQKAPEVNFDIKSLTKELARVVERALDQPLPAVNLPTERLEEILAQALSSPKLPDVHFDADLTGLADAIAEQSETLAKTADAMASVAVVLSSLIDRLEKLEAVVSKPRTLPKLRIVHGEDASEIEEVSSGR